MSWVIYVLLSPNIIGLIALLIYLPAILQVLRGLNAAVRSHQGIFNPDLVNQMHEALTSMDYKIGEIEGKLSVMYPDDHIIEFFKKDVEPKMESRHEQDIKLLGDIWGEMLESKSELQEIVTLLQSIKNP
jgi:hypothetical protein